MRVTNIIHLGCSLLLPVGTVNSVQTLKVLTAAVTSANSSAIRTYAHCASANAAPPSKSGGVTVLVMNLHPTATANITLTTEFDNGGMMDFYTLTPSPTASPIAAGNSGLLGTYALLNGRLLETGYDPPVLSKYLHSRGGVGSHTCCCG
jgi:hypothetical protein